VTIAYWLLWAGAGTFTMSSFWLILFYFGCDLLGTILGSDGGVAYVCHLVGAAGGVATAVTLVVLGWLEPSRGEENLLQVLGIHEGRREMEEKQKRLVVRRRGGGTR
jgi:membrane associated rhomboid family serine protease